MTNTHTGIALNTTPQALAPNCWTWVRIPWLTDIIKADLAPSRENHRFLDLSTQIQCI